MSSPVNHGEKVRETLSGRWSTHNVDVDVGESPVRDRDLRHCRMNVSLNLTLLAPEARSGPNTYVTGEARPNKLEINLGEASTPG